MIKDVFYIDRNGKETKMYLPNMESLILEQDIFNPYLEGVLTITDMESFQDINVSYGDKIVIDFENPDNEEVELEPVRKEFIIYQRLPFDVKRTPIRSYEFRFTNNNLINADTRQVSKTYIGKTFKYIVEDLLDSAGVKYKVWGEYTDKINFTSPLWTPLKSISYLSQWNRTKEGHGGIVCFSNLLDDRLEIISLIDLFEGKYTDPKIEEYIKIHKKNPWEEAISYAASREKWNIADGIMLSKDIDYQRALELGAGQVTYGNFDLNENKIGFITKKITDLKYKRMSPYNPFTEKMVGANETYNWYTDNFEYGRDSSIDDRLLKILCDTIEIKTVVGATLNRKLGMVVKMDYPKQMSDTPNIPEYILPDKKYSGKYLIRTVKNMYNNGIAKQELTLITDGYNDSCNDTYKQW